MNLSGYHYLTCAICGHALVGVKLNAKSDAFFLDGRNEAACSRCIQRAWDEHMAENRAKAGETAE